jgi:hypothetical protein
MRTTSRKATASSRTHLAATSKSNGLKMSKPEKRRKQAAPQLSEKAKKLALKAFRKTYEAHHGKSS